MPAKHKILLATEKPFAAPAVKAIEEVFGTDYDVQKLEGYKSIADLEAAITDGAEAVIVRSDKITDDLMAKSTDSKLKLVVRAGAGVDTIDLESASKRGIVVMNTPGQNSNAVAELCFGMMITNARNHYDGTSGYELRGKILALHGFGQVARNMMRLAKGFEMEVWAYDPFLKPEDIEAGGAKPCAAVSDLFSANFVSLHIPCTPETRNSINKDLLLKLPKNGVLVNTARAEVVDETEATGILGAVKERPDIKYIADVVPMTEGLLEKLGKNAFVTPKKMGAQTSEANNNAGIAAAKQIRAFFESNDVKFQVNKPGQTF